MPLPAASLRYPLERVLLQRTRLAYVNLGNLLTDAKRDRAARVSGYVLVWLPEQLLILYMQKGEVANATASVDGRRFRALAISEALALVPNAAEIGEICFHECGDEQLAAMYWSQVVEPLAWPLEVNVNDPVAVLGFLHATVHDGVLEVYGCGGLNYGIVRHGRLVGAFLSDPGDQAADVRISALLEASRREDERRRARLWPVPPSLPVQAPPALIRAYRDLVGSVVERLVGLGAGGAPAVAEHARKLLAERHPALQQLSLSQAALADPVAETTALTAAVGAWLGELLWTIAPPDGTAPGALIGDVTRQRRHVFERAGLFAALPWGVD